MHGVCFAVLGANDRAMLTPVITTIEHATNVGLVGAVSRVVLDFLVDLGTKEVGYLVRVNDRAIERALERTGFRQSELRATTEFADYIEYLAAPEEVRARLGLADAKRGDILTLALNLDEFDALCQYHFALSSAIAPFLKDSFEHAALLPGLLDLVAELPIAGVPPGTPGPKTVRVLEPELDR